MAQNTYESRREPKPRTNARLNHGQVAKRAKLNKAGSKKVMQNAFNWRRSSRPLVTQLSSGSPSMCNSGWRIQSTHWHGKRRKKTTRKQQESLMFIQYTQIRKFNVYTLYKTRKLNIHTQGSEQQTTTTEAKETQQFSPTQFFNCVACP